MNTVINTDDINIYHFGILNFLKPENWGMQLEINKKF